MIKPSEEKKFMSFYEPSAASLEIPNMSEYDFLLKRNEPYMNNVAISFAGKEISYEEMHTRIEEYAQALYKRGVRKDDVVALGVANTPEAIYLEYALNRLGAIVAPINPTYNEFKTIRDLKIVRPKMYIGINDSYKTMKNSIGKENIEMIIFPAVRSIDNRLLHTLYGVKNLITGNALLKIDKSLDRLLNDGRGYNQAVFEGNGEDVSDIMFTGGSSGVHKGVELTSGGLNSVVQSLDYVTNLQPGEVFLGNLPMFMAFGKTSIHYALCKSLRVELTIKAYPNDFVDELIRTHPNGVWGGPIHWESLLGSKKLDSLDLTGLKMPVSGGEQLKAEKAKKINEILLSHGAESPLWDGLGMTEMWAPVAVKRGTINTFGSIGTAIPGNNAMVINQNTGEEASYGERGELYITGPGMMKGYRDMPEETESHTYIDESGIRWFKSGDIVIQQENGELVFVGRKKRCFVCGCDNIYPEEIEKMLTEISGVKEAVVTRIPSETTQFVSKYHVVLENELVEVKELERIIIETIKRTIGETALPSEIEYQLEDLPRTDNGKIDPKPLQEADMIKYENIKKTLKI